MAHGLLEYDWMLSAKERPWHGIGTVVEEAPTSEDAIRIARLDWTVDQFPVFANGNEIPGYFANVRSDTNEALGVVRNRYKIVQNTEAFDLLMELLLTSIWNAVTKQQAVFLMEEEFSCL